MVVEDHTEARAAMLLLLEAEGYDAVGAVDGQEGLDHLRREGASLILLDLMLPHKNGAEFRAEQLRDSALAAIPVIVISAADNVADKAAGLGVKDYLPKPLDVDLLLPLVARYCPKA